MKRKIAFWIAILLANTAVGAVSVRSYLNVKDEIAGLRAIQKIYSEKHINYDAKLEELAFADKQNAASLLGILGFDGKYDFNNNLVRERDLNKFFDYKVYVRTVVTLEISEELRELNPDSAKTTKKGSKSPAIVIGGKYVLMASHTNDAGYFKKEVVRFPMPQGVGVIEMQFNLKVLEHTITISLPSGEDVALIEIYRNREKDFSLFEIPKNYKVPNFPFEIGDSSQLKVGHYLYMNGRPSIDFEVARPGYVTALADMLPNMQDDEMEISQSTDYGDSGSPIIAFRDGKPEVVGIYLGWWSESGDNGKNTRSRALKINTAVDEIKEKLGINLRELQRRILNN